MLTSTGRCSNAGEGNLQVTEKAVYGMGAPDDEVHNNEDHVKNDLLMESDDDVDDEDNPAVDDSPSPAAAAAAAAAPNSFVVPKLHGKELKSVKWMQINNLAPENIA